MLADENQLIAPEQLTLTDEISPLTLLIQRVTSSVMCRKPSLEQTAEKHLTYIGGIVLSKACVNNSLLSFALDLSVKSTAG